MTKRDDFDMFLERELKKATREFEGEAFTQRVISSVPSTANRNRMQNFVILLSCLVACVLCFLIIDLGSIAGMVQEIFLLYNEATLPSFMTILFIATICFIGFLIPGVEYNRGIA